MRWVKACERCLGADKCYRSEFFGLDDKDHSKDDMNKSFVAFKEVSAARVSIVQPPHRAGSTGDGNVERDHMALFEIPPGLFLQFKMSPLFGREAYRYAEVVYNKISTNHTGIF